MVSGRFALFPLDSQIDVPRAAGGLTLILAMVGFICAWGDSVPAPSKQIIGATANLTETTTGFVFPARIDTGAQTCSLHVEKFRIEHKQRKRADNVGKTIHFLVINEEGEQQWITSKIARAVRIKSGLLEEGQYDRRYKVPLTFEWNGFRKEVLVTLNNRTHMEYPLLIGRNFLSGDFLVDVDVNDKR